MVATATSRQVENSQDEWPQPEAGPGGTRLHIVVAPARVRRERTLAELRALVLWPRLDPRILAYARGDVDRLARAISRRRSALTEEQIRRLLSTDAEGGGVDTGGPAE